MIEGYNRGGFIFLDFIFILHIAYCDSFFFGDGMTVKTGRIIRINYFAVDFSRFSCTVNLMGENGVRGCRLVGINWSKGLY